MSTSTPITLASPYVVIDSRTGIIVYRTTYAHRKRARSVADRMDRVHGAVRYLPQLERVST